MTLLHVLMAVLDLLLCGFVLGQRPRSSGPWLLAVLALLLACWSALSVFAAHAPTKGEAMESYRLAELLGLLVGIGVFHMVVTEGLNPLRPAIWLTVPYAATLAVAVLVVAGQVLRTPFMSPLGWLMAPAAWASLLGAWMVAIYGAALALLGWSAPRWVPATPAVRWTVLATALPFLYRDAAPLLLKQAWFLPCMPTWLTLAGFALGVCWARRGRLFEEDVATASPLPPVPATQETAESGRELATWRSAAERLRVLMEHASDSILILDGEGSIHYHSPALRRLIGQHTTYMPGANFLHFVHPDDRAPLSQILTDLVQSAQKTLQVEFRMQRKTNEWAWMQGRATNLLQHPDIEGIVFNLKDISHSKKLEDQLMQAQKMEAVGRLAGGIAHDFNNLLTAIQGYADILVRSLPDGTEESEYVHQIMQAGDRAAALTQQLLAFSRQKTVQQQKVLLNEVLEGMRDMVDRLVGEDIGLTMNLSPRAGFIMADPIQIQQIVLNLVVNARDAMPKGGTIVVETGGQMLTESAARPGVRPGEYAVLMVTDTGAGMTKEVMAHIFEPFFTTKAVGKGTGLGLSMVYGIVEQGGGHIDVESAPGKGTTFRIYLPQLLDKVRPPSLPSQPQAPRPGPPPLLPTRAETILVVEDADVIRRLAQRILSAKGYNVLVASHGVDALRVSDEHKGPIHLMLTDVVMPNMNGVELASRLAEKRPDTRVLFMSGYVPEGSKGDTDMSNTLQKPFTAETLVAKVREVMR